MYGDGISLVLPAERGHVHKLLNRAALRAHVFPLGGEPREDAGAGMNAAERLALVADLSREMWALTGRPVPTYTRAEMPVAMIPSAGREG